MILFNLVRENMKKCPTGLPGIEVKGLDAEDEIHVYLALRGAPDLHRVVDPWGPKEP